RWRGGDKHSGVTKVSQANDIVALMGQHGAIESSYRTAREWLDNTGQGIEDEETIKNEIRRRCPNYFDLDDDSETESKLDGDANEDLLSSKKQSNSHDKKRSAAQAKIDDWAEINRQSYDLKKSELSQREEELRLKREIEDKRIKLEEQRESRLAQESMWNVELLALKAKEAQWEFEHKQETAAFEKRLKTIQTRKRLKEDGMTMEEIDNVCPL
ncbi:hypothetical protein AeMF1_014341, partial [Aphanomyces euteiches]